YAEAQNTLSKVRDGYKTLQKEFNAAEKLFAAETSAAQAKAAWLKRKKAYALADPKEVTLAVSAETAAKEAQYAGSFVTALSDWQITEQKWRDAHSVASKLNVAQQKSAEAKVAWLKRKKAYGLSDPSEAKLAATTEESGKAAQISGDLGTALTQWQRAEQQWRAAYKTVGDEVARIDQIKSDKAAAERKFAADRKAAISRQAAAAISNNMVSIPGGSFRMGDLNSDARITVGRRDELPVHSVRVSGFKMSKHEITFAAWDACVSAGGCSYIPDEHGWGRGNRPVIHTSWDDITQQFIPWLNKITGKRYRLPSEAEWEYAARAGTSTEYSWGDSIGSNRANCDGCGSRWDDSKTAPVGSFSANRFGLYDMLGNVSEWTQDCYKDSYVGAPSNGSASTSGDCSRRVLRGGSWDTTPRYLPVSLRRAGRVEKAYIDYGFRLVHD
uniref:SUMF1/EgtB/PvdO family nonheme iron enzyme n=1 Tax=Zhongshania sp. TaxID=1971902 RepID=UPI00356245FD